MRYIVYKGHWVYYKLQTWYWCIPCDYSVISRQFESQITQASSQVKVIVTDQYMFLSIDIWVLPPMKYDIREPINEIT